MTPTKPMSAEEMEPCPKCQQTDALALVQVSDGGGWGVSCFNCHLGVDTRAETTAYAVIDWNRRASPPHPEGEGVLVDVRTALQDSPDFRLDLVRWLDDHTSLSGRECIHVAGGLRNFLLETLSKLDPCNG